GRVRGGDRHRGRDGFGFRLRRRLGGFNRSRSLGSRSGGHGGGRIGLRLRRGGRFCPDHVSGGGRSRRRNCRCRQIVEVELRLVGRDDRRGRGGGSVAIAVLVALGVVGQILRALGGSTFGGGATTAATATTAAATAAAAALGGR